MENNYLYTIIYIPEIINVYAIPLLRLFLKIEIIGQRRHPIGGPIFRLEQHTASVFK